jgi:very-short-patch-repair endonuclease
VLFHESGLPAPRLQAEFTAKDGSASARADFYWPQYKTIAEADGMLKDNDPDNPGAMRAQFRRDRLLRDLEYKVVHFTWDEVFTNPN